MITNAAASPIAPMAEKNPEAVTARQYGKYVRYAEKRLLTFASIG